MDLTCPLYFLLIWDKPPFNFFSSEEYPLSWDSLFHKPKWQECQQTKSLMIVIESCKLVANPESRNENVSNFKTCFDGYV